MFGGLLIQPAILIWKHVMKRHLLLYYPLDDPLFADQDSILQTYVDNHCDIIEIAVPVEDPVLDGKTIRDSMSRILQKTDRNTFFEDISKLKRKHPEVAVQLMAYRSVIEEEGVDRFLKKANEVGITYVLSPDADEALLKKMDLSLNKKGISIIRFSSLSSEEKELEKLKDSEGYIFQRSTDGKTGGSGEFPVELKNKIASIKNSGIETPVVVGFGISTPSQVKELFEMNADGAVIGSALFKHILDKDLDIFLSQFNEWYD